MLVLCPDQCATSRRVHHCYYPTYIFFWEVPLYLLLPPSYRHVLVSYGPSLRLFPSSRSVVVQKIAAIPRPRQDGLISPKKISCLHAASPKVSQPKISPHAHTTLMPHSCKTAYDSSDSDSIELMTPISTPIFTFHYVKSALMTPTTALAPTP